MRIKLSDHFGYKRLIGFTLPSIAMMIFTSIYGVVDGFFVSNFAGKTPFAAINLIMPFLMILSTLGFMFGTGGSAIVAKKLGEGEGELANKYFSLFVYFSFALSVVIAAVSFIFMDKISAMLGAEGEMLRHCTVYGRIMSAALPFFVLQLEFQSFFITAETPKLGFFVTVASGLANMLLDALLVGLLPLEYKLIGAAVASGASQVVGGTVPLVYFARDNKSLLRFKRTSFFGRVVLQAVVNGSSEFMRNVSMSIVGILYNFRLMHYAGENGIAAYGVMMYVSMIFAAAFIGYSIGIAPVVGYNDGARNKDELRGVFTRSLVIIGSLSLAMTLFSELLSVPLSALFVSGDASLMALTVRGFRIFSLAFLFMGFAIFSSCFFTALNDGVTSAIISFLRTLVFQVGAVMLLPLIMDIDGIWLSVAVAELMAVVISAIFLFFKRKRFS